MSTKRATPIRMCVGCGGREHQSQLLRFALGPEGVLIPGRGRGRSGYLHPRRECMHAFVTSRTGFVRSLGVVVLREARERYVTLITHSTTL